MGLPSATPSATFPVITHQTQHPNSTHPFPQQSTQGWGRIGADGKRARLPKKPTPHHHARHAAQDADEQRDHRKHLYHTQFITVIAPAPRSNGCTFATALSQPISAVTRHLKPTILSNHNISRPTILTNLHADYQPSWTLHSLISVPIPRALIISSMRSKTPSRMIHLTQTFSTQLSSTQLNTLMGPSHSSWTKNSSISTRHTSVLTILSEHSNQPSMMMMIPTSPQHRRSLATSKKCQQAI